MFAITPEAALSLRRAIESIADDEMSTSLTIVAERHIALGGLSDDHLTHLAPAMYLKSLIKKGAA